MRNMLGHFILMMTCLLGCQLSFAEEPKREHYFVTVADIHFSPFIGCTRKSKPCTLLLDLKKAPVAQWEGIFNRDTNHRVVGYYQDTNYALLKATLVELKRVNKQMHPDFVLLLGDFLAHNFREDFVKFSHDRSRQSYQAFVKKTMQFMTNEIQKTFPNIDVYPVIGNNDTYTGDYRVVPQGAFLDDMEQIWSPLIKDEKNRALFQASFDTGGYYEVTLPSNRQNKIILLNTVLFSDRVHNPMTHQAALTQLNWFHNKLSIVHQNKERVLVAFHIPIGIDVFATIKNKFDIKEFWQVGYTKKFEASLKQYSQSIAAILPAHIHMNTFQIIVLKQLADIPVNFTPSISPIFGNNPGFKVFTYDPTTLKLTHVENFRYQLNSPPPTWSSLNETKEHTA